MRLHTFFLLPNSHSCLNSRTSERRWVPLPAPAPPPPAYSNLSEGSPDRGIFVNNGKGVRRWSFSAHSLVTEPHQVDDRFSQPQRSFKNSSFALTFRLRHGGACSVTVCKTCRCGSALWSSLSSWVRAMSTNRSSELANTFIHSRMVTRTRV